MHFMIGDSPSYRDRTSER
uniref:Uncharacterized protein n=1 Tax=Rhizophora mucronata TaxID=61149 RepID=A0A2P2N3U3_RHIMU